jgi:hypothetical protein
MHRLVWLAIPLALCGCGGKSSSNTLSITCSGRTALVGATSIDILGDAVDGHPTLRFPDPANPGKTGTMFVQSHDHCTIIPTDASGV